MSLWQSSTHRDGIRTINAGEYVGNSTLTRLGRHPSHDLPVMGCGARRNYPRSSNTISRVRALSQSWHSGEQKHNPGQFLRACFGKLFIFKVYES